MHRLFGGASLPVKKPRNETLSHEQKQSNREQKQKRVCIEHTMRRLKVFKILSYRYRNHRKRFALRFNLIAALLNRDLPKPSAQTTRTTAANNL